MTTTAIDWSQLRNNLLLATQRIELYNPSYWDKESDIVDQHLPHWAELTREQLKKVPLSKEITVLDVGAGTGRMTLLIAKRVKHVTALEPSKKMLDVLREKAKKQQIFNIDCVNESFEQLEMASQYDLVIASFSLFMFDIKTALLKMDMLASKGVYLFMSASPWLDEELQKTINDNISYWSDFILIYNILYHIGITPNVDIWDYDLKQSYTNLDSAFSRFNQINHIPPEKKDKLRDFLREKMVEEKGKMWYNRKRKAATIWWTKNK